MRPSGAAVLAAAWLLGGPAGAAAQESPEEPQPFEEVLYPPELIMQHRRAIGLSDEQRARISDLIGDLQGTVVRLRWELLDEMEGLTSTLERTRVDLDLALDQLNSALELEKEIKQAHLEALIRIKNLLDPEQQAELDRLREGGSGPPAESQGDPA
ncbi:MAG: hypothetical protein PVI57_18995 [Gemmatimonadota bacterium]|jgi:Spy/CpxP family protein refolding chaperone